MSDKKTSKNVPQEIAKSSIQAVQDRLHRIEGQVRGIEKMLDLNQPLDKVLIQIQAVISSLESLRSEMMKQEIRKKLVEQIDKTMELVRM